MAKSTAFDTALLQMIFNGNTTSTGTPLFANPTSTPATVLYCALHTADPLTVAGSGTVSTQNASEIAYTSYARKAVTRDTTGWTVTGANVFPTSDIQFVAGTGGSGTASFFSIGTGASGATAILYSGSINPSIVCGLGVTPVLSHLSSITEG